MIDPLIDAFMSVGVIVAGVMLLVGGLRMIWGDRFEQALRSSRRWGPLTGALLSFPPGCVGVLTAVRLYGKGEASYGTAIASLTATMGDSAWLLLAADPILTLKLKLLLCGLGCVLGYAIDRFEIDPAKARSSQTRNGMTASATACAQGQLTASTRHGPGNPGSSSWTAPLLKLRLLREASREGTAPTPLDRRMPSLGSRLALSGVSAPRIDVFFVVVLFWALAVLGLALSIPVYFQLLDADELASLFGQVDLYQLIGIAGFSVSSLVFLGSRKKLCCDETAANGKPTLRDTLIVTGKEVAFVTVWTGLAFLAWEAAAAIWIFDPADIRLAGAAGVIIGALAGLIPACGVEILFASLFLSGTIPLSALIAYLISEDGSGLIPLAALRPKSAVLSAAITTVPALAVGFAALLFGW